MKRTCSAAVVLLLSLLLPITAVAASQPGQTQVGGINFEIRLGNGIYYAEVIKPSQDMDDYTGMVEIPETVEYNGEYYPVTSIGNAAFAGTTITTIVIPQTVTQIGYGCFTKCEKLDSAVFASVASLCRIDFKTDDSNPVFVCKHLYLADREGEPAVISIPGEVTTVGRRAFAGASALQEVYFHDNVTSIGESAFKGCKALKSLTLPDNYQFTTIASGLALGCEQLESVVMPNSVTTIGSMAFFGCVNLTELTLSSQLESIGDNAFRSCSKLTSFVSPRTLSTFGSSVFLGCSGLEKLVFSPSLSSFGEGLIAECTSLTTITLSGPNKNFSSPEDTNALLSPDGKTLLLGCVGTKVSSGVEAIGTAAFKGCTGLTTIDLNTIKAIGDRSFSGCTGLTEVLIPSTVKTIGVGAFSQCSRLRSFTLEADLTSLPASLLSGCSALSSVTLPNTVSKVNDEAFKGCSRLTVLPSLPSLVTIGTSAFENCTGLVKVELPSHTDTVGVRAFMGCRKMTELTIPQSVGTIANYSFMGCSALENVYYYADPSACYYAGSVGLCAFDLNTIGNMTIYVDDAGQFAGEPWTLFKKIELLSNHLFEYKDGQGNVQLYMNLQTVEATGQRVAEVTIAPEGKKAYAGNIVIPSVVRNNGKDYTVTTIVGNAFANSDSLLSVTIPATIESIGQSAFEGCSYLRKVTLADGIALQTIADRTFYGCDSLLSVNIPASVSTIGELAFARDKSLQSIALPSAIASIGRYAFQDCSALKTVTISENAAITVIDDQVFEHCTSLTEMVLPAKVETIGKLAFNYCSSMASLTLPKGLKKIDDQAFAHCEALKSVAVPNSVSWLGTEVFASCISLQEVTLPDQLDFIPVKMFANCISLTSLPVAKKTTTIGESAFSGCSGLTVIDIPDGIATIGDKAFADCKNASQINLPASLYTIGAQAFAGCNKVTVMNMKCTPADLSQLDDNAFTGLPLQNITLYGTFNDYSIYTKEPWQSFKSIEDARGQNVVLDGLTYNLSFRDGMATLIAGSEKYKGDIVVPSVIYYMDYHFSVGAIADNAFRDCTELTSVKLQPAFTIGDFAFKGCTALKSVKIISPWLHTIGQEAFQGCTSLASINIPEDVTVLSKGVFKNCSSLTAIELPSKLQTIDAEALAASGVTLLDIPSSVHTIGVRALRECHQLTAVTLPGSIGSIGNGAFQSCSHLKDIYCFIPDTLYVTVGSSAFPYKVATLHVLEGQKEMFQEATGWKDFATIVEMAPRTLTYLVDGTIYEVFTGITEGTLLTLLPEPVKDGHRFSGWSELPPMMPGQDVEVSGCFTYSISYVLNTDGHEEELRRDTLFYGAKTTIPEAPKVDGYKVEWDGVPATMPARDTVVVGRYVPRKFAMSYVIDGELLRCDSITYGSPVTPPDAPEREGYTFAGWKGVPQTMPSRHLVATGSYTVNTYKLVLVVDGVSYVQQLVDYGTEIVLPVMEEREGYIFRWETVPGTMPARDLVVNGSYRPIPSGDANADGAVDVADVVAVVNYILEQPADNFYLKAADVNGDEVIDAADVVVIVNIILDEGKVDAARMLEFLEENGFVF